MNILELSQKRFSVRKYSDKPVSEEDLQYILESVRMAPSAVNRQPWKFVIVKSEAARKQLQECYDREWFKSAPLYIICMREVDSNWIRKLKETFPYTGFEPVAIIPVGHIADDCPTNEKKRKTLEEITDII